MPSLHRKCDGMNVDFVSYHYCYNYCQYDYYKCRNVGINVDVCIRSFYCTGRIPLFKFFPDPVGGSKDRGCHNVQIVFLLLWVIWVT